VSIALRHARQAYLYPHEQFAQRVYTVGPLAAIRDAIPGARHGDELLQPVARQQRQHLTFIHN
jgi:hypothetical protein